ncbi:FecR domain-containing protein [Thiorhodococcus fuscus]|uniref:FecR domain-containing protein n=1 Tax=Thiorhodococcus fuscus TaxID=527200 RepID=A0ABW4Y724_9GAMM
MTSRVSFRVCMLLLGALWGPIVLADETLSVTVGPDQVLRDLAADYLGDPNAWPEILRANRLDAPHQVQPGMSLNLPVRAMRDLGRALIHLRGLIYRATAAGAEVFATQSIASALSDQASAMEAQRLGDLAEALRLARSGIVEASRALDRSLSQRDVAAEAVLDAAGGVVQRRLPSEYDWTPIPIRTLLAEHARLRTLERSFALVRFRDASSLRMSEHAQLEIRRLRRDRLTRSETVDVVLYGGDLRAIIAPGGRQTLRVELPGIETSGDSTHYWLRKSPDDTRLANYAGEFWVSAGGGSVVVGQNQGTLVEAGRPPVPPIDLLPPPGPISPEQGAVRYGKGVALVWSPVPGARTYWVEIARDPQFSRLVFTDTDVRGTERRVPIEGEGLYYWRLSSVDSSGLPGPASVGRVFQIASDSTPPFLMVETPIAAQRVADAAIAVRGRTEPDARLWLDGESIAVEADGRFSLERPLSEGPNRLVFEARDAAGNLGRLERVLYRTPGSPMPLRMAEGVPRDDRDRLLVASRRFALSGVTLPGASVRIDSEDDPTVSVTAPADADGHFDLILPARTEGTRFHAVASGPLGERAESDLEVVLDGTPPRILLDQVVPRRTSDPHLSLSGRVEDGESLEFDGQSVALSEEGTFAFGIPLRSGENRIRLVARDRAGNRATLERSLLLDREPPRLTAYRLSEEIGPPRRLRVEIAAEDASGLTAGVPYRLQIGETLHQGVARRGSERDDYEDWVALPADLTAKPRLRSVQLRDYLGNRREVVIE